MYYLHLNQHDNEQRNRNLTRRPIDDEWTGLRGTNEFGRQSRPPSSTSGSSTVRAGPFQSSTAVYPTFRHLQSIPANDPVMTVYQETKMTSSLSSSVPFQLPHKQETINSSIINSSNKDFGHQPIPRNFRMFEGSRGNYVEGSLMNGHEMQNSNNLPPSFLSKHRETTVFHEDPNKSNLQQYTTHSDSLEDERKLSRINRMMNVNSCSYGRNPYPGHCSAAQAQLPTDENGVTPLPSNGYVFPRSISTRKKSSYDCSMTSSVALGLYPRNKSQDLSVHANPAPDKRSSTADLFIQSRYNELPSNSKHSQSSIIFQDRCSDLEGNNTADYAGSNSQRGTQVEMALKKENSFTKFNSMYDYYMDENSKLKQLAQEGNWTARSCQPQPKTLWWEHLDEKKDDIKVCSRFMSPTRKQEMILDELSSRTNGNSGQSLGQAWTNSERLQMLTMPSTSSDHVTSMHPASLSTLNNHNVKAMMATTIFNPSTTESSQFQVDEPNYCNASYITNDYQHALSAASRHFYADGATNIKHCVDFCINEESSSNAFSNVGVSASRSLTRIHPSRPIHPLLSCRSDGHVTACQRNGFNIEENTRSFSILQSNPRSENQVQQNRKNLQLVDGCREVVTMSTTSSSSLDSVAGHQSCSNPVDTTNRDGSTRVLTTFSPSMIQNLSSSLPGFKMSEDTSAKSQILSAAGDENSNALMDEILMEVFQYNAESIENSQNDPNKYYPKQLQLQKQYKELNLSDDKKTRVNSPMQVEQATASKKETEVSKQRRNQEKQSSTFTADSLNISDNMERSDCLNRLATSLAGNNSETMPKCDRDDEYAAAQILQFLHVPFPSEKHVGIIQKLLTHDSDRLNEDCEIRRLSISGDLQQIESKTADKIKRTSIRKQSKSNDCMNSAGKLESTEAVVQKVSGQGRKGRSPKQEQASAKESIDDQLSPSHRASLPDLRGELPPWTQLVRNDSIVVRLEDRDELFKLDDETALSSSKNTTKESHMKITQEIRDKARSSIDPSFDALFVAMAQMIPCKLTADDQNSAITSYKHHDLGFPGLSCRHCSGRPGSGRYFPNSVRSLSQTTTAHNMIKHFVNASKIVPDDVSYNNARHEMMKQTSKITSLETSTAAKKNPSSSTGKTGKKLYRIGGRHCTNCPYSVWLWLSEFQRRLAECKTANKGHSFVGKEVGDQNKDPPDNQSCNPYYEKRVRYGARKIFYNRVWKRMDRQAGGRISIACETDSDQDEAHDESENSNMKLENLTASQTQCFTATTKRETMLNAGDKQRRRRKKLKLSEGFEAFECESPTGK